MDLILSWLIGLYRRYKIKPYTYYSFLSVDLVLLLITYVWLKTNSSNLLFDLLVERSGDASPVLVMSFIGLVRV